MLKITSYIIVLATVCLYAAPTVYSQNISRYKQPLTTINSRYSEIAPVPSTNGKRLYFARITPENNPERNCDIWCSEIKSDGKLSAPTKMPSPLNSKYDNVVIKATENCIYLEGLYNKDYEYISPNGISKAELKNNQWIITQLNIKNLNNKSIHSSYAFSSNNRVLIIAADRDGGVGQLDLYVSFLINENTYSQPVNIGATVNTRYNDGTPFIAEDNTTLYFSSYGHNSNGSSDIYMTRRLDDTWTNWTEPVNLGAQFNTPYWDAYPYIAADSKRFYMVSSDANANEDIYIADLPPELMPMDEYEIKGLVTDNKRHETVSAQITLKDRTSNTIVSTCYPNDQGEYSFTVKKSGNYTIETESPYHLDWENKINIKADKHIYINNIELVKIENGTVFTLGQVFFQPSSYQLNPESTHELNKLARLMKNNPTLRLTVNGYTASGMDSKDLKILSENRAKAVKTYLVKQGVASWRITAVGYGEITDPAEKGNRKRVEFVLTY